MTRGLLVLSLLAATASASAQQTKAPATKQDPKTTVPATKSALPPATKTAAPATKTASAPAQAAASTKAPAPADTKAAAPGATKSGAGATKTGAPPQGQPGLAVAAEQQRSRAPVIMREIFDYNAEGRRDPFFSLLATNELRPTVTDLRVVGITFDPSGRRSIVTLRDIQTNTRYNVTTGTTLGRMKVVLIKPKAIYFSIEEFGLNRQDSLVLGDTSKVRIR